MMFVTGPLFSGKRTFVKSFFGWNEDELRRFAVLDAQDLAPAAEDLEALADRLAAAPVVIAAETGCGVVPMDPGQREARESAGRLACLLAARADTVVRLCCGLPEVLKGELP